MTSTTPAHCLQRGTAAQAGCYRSFAIDQAASVILSIILVVSGAQTSSAADPQSFSLPSEPIKATGISRSEFRSFDEMMETFLKQHRVPGASLAVTRAGKLVYARGFGYAELDGRRNVEPDSLFRIASISKPITAFAVLQLSQRGKIQLDEPVFPQLGLETNGDRRDQRLKDVTVRHLLQHTGGWDRNLSFDPMSAPTRAAVMKQFGLSYPFDPAYIVQFMLDKPLDFDPGTRMSYSNFGYCILGRLIHAASGKPYEKYVKQSVLAPMGIRRMQIGQTASYQPAEVRYYHRDKSAVDRLLLSRGLAVEVYESHGGWIASTIDLVRFAHENDELVAKTRRGRRQLLSPDHFLTMFARPGGDVWLDSEGALKPSFYGCGWNVRPKTTGRNIWHTGSLIGSSTLLVRRHDGLCWAVLFNTRDGNDGKGLSGMIDPLIHKAAGEVQQWPERLDLFRRY